GTGTRPDGHGGGDDPSFIAHMAPYVNNAEYAVYWDFAAADYNAKLSGAPQPGAMTAFMDKFGATSTAGSASPVAEERTAGQIVRAKAATYTAQTAPILTCTNCYVGAVQNAPGRWLAIIWSSTAQRSATLSWGYKAGSAGVYDPSLGATASETLTNASSITVPLAASKPLVIAIQN
ncbi:MAG: hypothetical protein JO303_00915, partial [Caulobacteraceae bacterium]|nr:hypothetical protein [Caulobacteraceae bacterium]